jgi:hypothetical protein
LSHQGDLQKLFIEHALPIFDHVKKIVYLTLM